MYINRLQETGHKAVGMATDHGVDGLGGRSRVGEETSFSTSVQKNSGAHAARRLGTGTLFRG
jgi:hypothetical protein